MNDPAPYDLDTEALSAMPFLCACFNVRRASRAITQLYEEAMSGLDLKATQFSLLVGILFMGEQGVSTLADTLGMDRTTASRSVRSLEQRGLIESLPSGDRRTHAMRITAQGAALLNEAYPRWQHAQDRVKDALGEDQMNQLLTLMGHVAALAPDTD